MKLSQLIIEFIAEVEAITGLETSSAYSETADDSIVVLCLGTSDVDEIPISYDKRGVIKSATLSLTIKTSTYARNIDVIELLRDKFGSIANYQVGKFPVMSSNEVSYSEFYDTESRRHFSSIDFSFIY